MRHYFLPRAITVHASGMGPTAGKARLVALRGRSLGLPARLLGALATAVDLASVAAAADHRLVAAGHTQKQPA
jgi:hypothetical protein